MAAKKIITSPLIPILLLAVLMFWPTFQAITAASYLWLSPIKIDSSDISAPREFQRYFQTFGVPLELHRIELVPDNKVFRISVPFGINLPLTGRMEYSVLFRFKTT